MILLRPNAILVQTVLVLLAAVLSSKAEAQVEDIATRAPYEILAPGAYLEDDAPLGPVPLGPQPQEISELGSYLPQVDIDARDLSSERPVEMPSAYDAARELDSSGKGSWRWQQVLAAPRIGGRLTTVTVDQTNPSRLFVGTEEGTVLRSTDGGVTWREIEISPHIRQHRGLTRVEVDMSYQESFHSFLEPMKEGNPVNHRLLPRSGFGKYIFHINSIVVYNMFLPGSHIGQAWLFPLEPRLTPSENLLNTTLEGDGEYLNPVKHIAICPGSPFPILVATREELWGSYDDGLTYVQLFQKPSTRMLHVVCSKTDTSEILLLTTFGVFSSNDGGVTFQQDTSGQPGRPSYAAAIRSDGTRFVASEAGLYVGAGGLIPLYPDYNNSGTIPWTTILWVETIGDQIWLGTRDGLRASYDGGTSWHNIARLSFGRHSISQVVAGSTEDGRPRIAVIALDCNVAPTAGGTTCRNTSVWASDDGGDNWYPFFVGMTRRTIRRMAAVPGAMSRWWVVTGGELWSTAAPQQQPHLVDERAARWARDQLRTTIPLWLVIDDVLTNLHLDEQSLESLARQSQFRALPIRADFGVKYHLTDDSRFETRYPLRFSEIYESEQSRDLEVTLTLRWRLGDSMLSNLELHPRRTLLYRLRQDVAFALEDAWHERMIHLRHLARGMNDPLQIAVLKARIESLNTIIATWLERPPTQDALSAVAW